LKLVVDTYAWVEFFVGSEKGEKVKEVIAESWEVLVPDIVLAELARKYLREGVDENIARQRVEWITDIARNVPIDEEIAVLSAKAYLELREKAKKEGLPDPSLADGLILAVTRATKAKVITGDKHFRGLKEVIWIGD